MVVFYENEYIGYKVTFPSFDVHHSDTLQFTNNSVVNGQIISTTYKINNNNIEPSYTFPDSSYLTNISFMSDEQDTGNGFEMRIDKFFLGSPNLNIPDQPTLFSWKYYPSKWAVRGGADSEDADINYNNIGRLSASYGLNNRANGYASATFGENNIANGYSSFVVGKYNHPIISVPTSGVVQPLFIVGNGTSPTLRSNAFVVNQNGKIGVGTNIPDVKLNIDNGTEVTLSDGTGFLLLGNKDSDNLVCDKNKIQARNNGQNSTLYLQPHAGNLESKATTNHLNSITNASLTNDGVLRVGGIFNLNMDGNEIQARNNTTASTLNLQPYGGNVNIGATLTVNEHQVISGGGSIVPLKIIGGTDANVTGDSSGYLLIGNSTGENIVIDNNEIIARNNSDVDNLSLQNNGGTINIGADNFNVTTSGRVGINIASDATHYLKVYNGSSTGTYQTTGWQHTSDQRLKTNIKTLSSSLAKILQLRGVSFNWKNNPNDDNQIGFIAQEVEPLFPEAVSKDEDGMYSMAYQNLVAPLVEAIKEQQAMIEKLKAENAELKASHTSELSSIKAEIELLKSYFINQTISKK
jgi:hypothetical protein